MSFAVSKETVRDSLVEWLVMGQTVLQPGGGAYIKARSVTPGAVRFGLGWVCHEQRVHTVSWMFRSGTDKGPVWINTEAGISWRATRGLLRGVAWLLGRPQVSGAENIPSEGAVILAPVHRSNVDFLMLLTTTNRKPFFVTRGDLLEIPLLGNLLRRLGCIGVDKGANADRKVLRLCESVLALGQVLVVFPEGGLRRGPEVGVLTDGVSFLGARSGATVVPIGLSGTDKVLAIEAKIPRPRHVRVVVGEATVNALPTGKVPRRVIAAKSAQLREALQKVYDESRIGSQR